MDDKTELQKYHERKQLRLAQLRDRIQAIESNTASGFNTRDSLPELRRELEELTGHHEPIRYR